MATGKCKVETSEFDRKTEMMLSILITHYKRPDSLIACLNAIYELNIDIPHEIIVSDDCSGDLVLKRLRNLNIDKLVESNVNRGLASNLNRGLNACSGDYILYCQEDFLLQKSLKDIFEECFNILDTGKLDMIRLTANYKFNKLTDLSENIDKIPKFSIRNFNVNTFRYSDNPFITKPSFFEKYGYYLNNTSGAYGETEYAVRLLKLDASIGITKLNYAGSTGSESVLNPIIKKKKIKLNKRVHRFIRAARQHLEWLMYNPKKRKLFTFSNLMNKD